MDEKEKEASGKTHTHHRKNNPHVWAYFGILVLAIGIVVSLVNSQQFLDTRSRAAAIATGTVPAQMNGKMGTATINNLTTGATYKVVVSGSYFYRRNVPNYNNLWADAQWSDKDEQKAQTGCYCVRQQKPYFNGKGMDAQDLTASVSANHTYTYIWKATGPTLTLTMPDSKYADNVGGLNYAVYLDTTAALSPGASNSASLAPVASGSAVPSASVSAAPSAEVTISLAPTLPVASPTWQCITAANGVTDCSGGTGTQISTQPSETISSPVETITSGPTVFGGEPSVSPSVSSSPCTSTASVTANPPTNGHKNKGLLSGLLDQLKKLLKMKDDQNPTPDTNPCPSVSPTE